jgi:hypothetical protein
MSIWEFYNLNILKIMMHEEVEVYQFNSHFYKYKFDSLFLNLFIWSKYVDFFFR